MSGIVPSWNQESLNSFIESNPHAFMPGEVLGTNDINDSMTAYQVDEKDKSFAMFYGKAVLDKAKSREAGAPRYSVLPYVTIRQPGETSLVLDRPVTMADMRRWPGLWRRYNERRQNQADGTPVEAMFPFHPELVANLKASNILTVEALASMSDAGMANYGLGGEELRARARKYMLAVENPVGAQMAEQDRASDQARTDLIRTQNELSNAMRRIGELEGALAAMKTGQSIGPVSALPAIPGTLAQPGEASAPLGGLISEEQWEQALNNDAPISGEVENPTVERRPGRPRKL